MKHYAYDLVTPHKNYAAKRHTLCVVVFVMQRRLLNFPARATESEELTRAARAGFAPWRDGAGKLIGWRASPAKGARERVLVPAAYLSPVSDGRNPCSQASSSPHACGNTQVGRGRYSATET